MIKIFEAGPDNTAEIKYALSSSGYKSVRLSQNVVGFSGFDGAFRRQLARVKSVGGNVAEIEESCFAGCPRLEELNVHPGLTSIGPYAFADCNALSSANCFSDGRSFSVYAIGENAFQNTGFRNLNLAFRPDETGQYAYGDEVFASCANLEAVTYTGGNYAGDRMFAGCVALKSVAFNGAAPTNIGTEAFRDCSSLASVTLPRSTYSVGGQAFSGCASLTSVGMDGCVSLGSMPPRLFEGCAGLTSVSVPAAVTSLTSIDGDFLGGSAVTECRLLGVTSAEIEHAAPDGGGIEIRSSFSPGVLYKGDEIDWRSLIDACFEEHRPLIVLVSFDDGNPQCKQCKRLYDWFTSTDAYRAYVSSTKAFWYQTTYRVTGHPSYGTETGVGTLPEVGKYLRKKFGPYTHMKRNDGDTTNPGKIFASQAPRYQMFWNGMDDSGTSGRLYMEQWFVPHSYGRIEKSDAPGACPTTVEDVPCLGIAQSRFEYDPATGFMTWTHRAASGNMPVRKDNIDGSVGRLLSQDRIQFYSNGKSAEWSYTNTGRFCQLFTDAFRRWGYEGGTGPVENSKSYGLGFGVGHECRFYSAEGKEYVYTP